MVILAKHVRGLDNRLQVDFRSAMAFFPRVVRNLCLVFSVPAALLWMALLQFIPYAPAQATTIRVAVSTAVVVSLLISSLALRRWSSPLREALETKSPNAQLLARTNQTAHSLPGKIAVLFLVVYMVAIAVTSMILLHQGLPSDLVAAGDCIAGGASLLGAALGYALVVSAVGRALAGLTPEVEFRKRGSVRGKILALGFVLLTVTVVLFGALGYARFRVAADHDYLVGVEHAQTSTLIYAQDKHETHLAELVWLSSGVPTAQISADGKLLSKAGPEDIPWEELPRDIGVMHRSDGGGGWLMARTVGDGSILLSWLPESPLQVKRAQFVSDLVVAGLLTYLAAAILIWFFTQAITLPIQLLGRAAERVASGDFGASPASVSQDEMGRLAADFRGMAQRLAVLVGAVQEATRGVAHAASELSDIGNRVKAGALDQHNGTVSASSAVEAMQSSTVLVGKGVKGLSEYVSSTSAAITQMAAAMELVHQQGAELQQAMDFATKDVGELAQAGERAQTALQTLDQIAGQTGATLANVNAALSSLERGALASQHNAAEAEELAQVAAKVVEETVRGIESVRAAVGDAQQRVTVLGRRASDIDQIVDFISDVAGRTNLLSLNASIIATQAGEHGKAFAVVADQIRELAAQIANSTKSIGSIIRAVREDVEGTAALISRGDALAAEGVDLAQNSARSLMQIRGATAQGNESAAHIQSAVQGHVQSTREISDLVAMVTDGSHSVSEAFQRIGTSVAALQTVGRSMGNMAERLKRALEEQSVVGRGQMQALERMNVMIEGITGALEEHGSATQRVRDALQNLGEVSIKHENSVQELSDLGERLQQRASDLDERVGRFRVN